MLSEIKDFFVLIGDFFTTVWEFVVNLVTDLLDMIKLVGETVTKIPSYFSWLPEEVVISFVALFGIVVIYKILGREG